MKLLLNPHDFFGGIKNSKNFSKTILVIKLPKNNVEILVGCQQN